MTAVLCLAAMYCAGVLSMIAARDDFHFLCNNWIKNFVVDLQLHVEESVYTCISMVMPCY